MGMLDTRDNDLSFDGEERRANVVLHEGISCHERLTEWNGLLRAEEIVSIEAAHEKRRLHKPWTRSRYGNP